MDNEDDQTKIVCMCVVLWMCDCVVVCDAVVVAPFPLYILHPPPFALDLKVKDLMVCLHHQLQFALRI